MSDYPGPASWMYDDSAWFVPEEEAAPPVRVRRPYCAKCDSCHAVNEPHGDTPTEASGLCTRHGGRLFLADLGGPWLVCRHCLENVCESCEEPSSLCVCAKGVR